MESFEPTVHECSALPGTGVQVVYDAVAESEPRWLLYQYIEATADDLEAGRGDVMGDLL